MNLGRFRKQALVPVAFLAWASLAQAGGWRHAGDMQIIDETELGVIDLDPPPPAKRERVAIRAEDAEKLNALLVRAGVKREGSSAYLSQRQARNLICKGYGANFMCQMTDTATGKDLLLSAETSRSLQTFVREHAPQNKKPGELPREIHCTEDEKVAYPMHAGYDGPRGPLVTCELLY